MSETNDTLEMVNSVRAKDWLREQVQRYQEEIATGKSSSQSHEFVLKTYKELVPMVRNFAMLTKEQGVKVQDYILSMYTQSLNQYTRESYSMHEYFRDVMQLSTYINSCS